MHIAWSATEYVSGARGVLQRNTAARIVQVRLG